MESATSQVGASEFERLFSFLDSLWLSGYDIDARQYLALNHLLMALIAQGETFEDLSGLKTMIAPLVCSTPAEQEDFYRRFERWSIALQFERAARNRQASEPVESFEVGPSTRPRRLFPTRQVLQALGWAAGVLGLILVVLVILTIPPEFWTQIFPMIVGISAIVVVTLIGWLVWRAWKFYQKNQYITRQLTDQEPVYKKIPLKAYQEDILPVLGFKPIVSSLRRRAQAPSAEVDVENTVEHIVRSGWVEIIYRQRQTMPEYLVLIDRKSRLDQQACFAHEVLERLKSDGVFLHLYEFSGDPAVCFPFDQQNTPLHLEELQSRHPDARLLVFSGAGELYNPLSGRLQGWLAPLSGWRKRAILTAGSAHPLLLDALQAQDFVVLPMNLEGLGALAHAFETDTAPAWAPAAAAPLPAVLSERPLRWTGRDPLPDGEVNAILAELATYLGASGFYWLCACAVYPELRWELTLHLGAALKDEYDRPLRSIDRLLLLASLPWLRISYLPDWMRSALIDCFTPEQESRTRAVLAELLTSAFTGQDIELQFGLPENLSEQTRKFLQRLRRNAPREHAIKDEIFARFLLGGQAQRRAVRVPERIREYLAEKPPEASLPRVDVMRPSKQESAISNTLLVEDVQPSLNEKSNKPVISSQAETHQRYSPSYRAAETRQVMGWIRAGECACIVGLRGSGKSNFIRFILDTDTQQHYLGHDQTNFIIVLVNLLVLTERSEWGVYELILNNLEAELQARNMDTEIVDRVSSIHQSMMHGRDPLTAQRYLENCISILCQQSTRQIVLLFDEFDTVFRDLPPSLFRYLRATRDAYKDQISYIVVVTHDLPNLRDKFNNDVDHFHRLVSRNPCWVGPHDEADATQMINYLTSRRNLKLDEKEKALLFELSGGHARLLKGIMSLITIDNSNILTKPTLAIAKETVIERECKNIWESFSENEKAALYSFSNGDPLDEQVLNHLVARGLLRQKSKGAAPWMIFSSLLAIFIRETALQALPAQIGTYMIRSPRIVQIDGRRIDNLTELEFDLLFYLYEQRGRVCTKDDLLWNVYRHRDDNDAQGFTNEAIQALISRLRKKIEPLPNQPRYLVTVRGGGYQLVIPRSLDRSDKVYLPGEDPAARQPNALEEGKLVQPPVLPKLSVQSNILLNEFEKELIQNAHPNYDKILLEKEFGGGFSGTRVFLVLPVKASGARDAQIVTKIGLADDLKREKENYDNFAGPSLPFAAAQVRGYYQQGNQAALNYAFAGGGALGETITLEDYYHKQTTEIINKTLDTLLDQTLGDIWYSQDEPFNQLFRDEYGRHLIPHAELLKIVNAIYPDLSQVGGKRVQIPGIAGTYPNPLDVYPNLLDRTLKGRRSFVHGDLHLRNILIDKTGRGWLIDFAKVKKRHNMFDFIKLETYIRLMALSNISGAFSSNEYIQFEQSLNAATLDQDSTLPTNLELAKAYHVIRNIRRIARKYMARGADFKNEYFPALFLYVLSMLKYFPINKHVPTQLMFITSCQLVVDIFEEPKKQTILFPLKTFLIYAHEDIIKIRELYRYLEKQSARPWMDREDLLPGQDWQVEIPKALFDSDTAIICLSKNAIAKEGYLSKEIKFALDRAAALPDETIFIIPVKLEECDVPESLRRYHWVELYKNEGLQRLIQTLKFRAEVLKRSRMEITTEEASIKAMQAVFTVNKTVQDKQQVKTEEPFIEQLSQTINQLSSGDLDRYSYEDIAESIRLLEDFRSRYDNDENALVILNLVSDVISYLYVARGYATSNVPRTIEYYQQMNFVRRLLQQIKNL